MASWKKLVEINGHWRNGLRRVAEQRARVEEIERLGGDGQRARELLAILEAAVQVTGVARNQLLRDVRLATPGTSGEPRPSLHLQFHQR